MIDSTNISLVFSAGKSLKTEEMSTMLILSPYLGLRGFSQNRRTVKLIIRIKISPVLSISFKKESLT